jgi:hypothetical protein
MFEHDLIIITPKGKIQKRRRRFTREEVIAAFQKGIQRVRKQSNSTTKTL